MQRYLDDTMCQELALKSIREKKCLGGYNRQNKIVHALLILLRWEIHKGRRVIKFSFVLLYMLKISHNKNLKWRKSRVGPGTFFYSGENGNSGKSLVKGKGVDSAFGPRDNLCSRSQPGAVGGDLGW